MLLSRVARPLLAAVSVANGVETLINPKPRIEAIAPLLARGPAPVNPTLLVQSGAALKITAGLAMGLGWAPRLAATLLAVDLIPGTVADHPFAPGGAPDARKSKQQNFLSNCGLLGGLLLAIATSGGKRKRRKAR
ncbi:MAG: DoxX family membrane protein [Pseudonocardiaceae bacterium]